MKNNETRKTLNENVRGEISSAGGGCGGGSTELTGGGVNGVDLAEISLNFWSLVWRRERATAADPRTASVLLLLKAAECCWSFSLDANRAS